ncbi:hypothetical protein [Parapedobacter sp. 10938]|uniref:hypothetical protein n=1 Tax=Parapedobacter flavus TaxID=3110225 RepID=UPI002DB7A66B|nr:hypothetical protein [Parapedobacter sp. 10938]MEC3881421.1 hypothetical protein [Parapedobacter sp. 10938]
MLTYADIDANKKALLFEVDDVLFPKKDYLLQVYYLFAHLLEYTETVPPAAELIDFLKTAYEHHGEAGLFERAAEAFAIDTKYRVQFEGMHKTARLPAKLLLYQAMLDFMRDAHQHGRQLLVFTEGDPTMQLNKLRHVEWNGLDQQIKVYFRAELRAKGHEPLDYLLQENGWHAGDVLYVHAPGDPDPAISNRVDCLAANRFFESPAVSRTSQRNKE